MINPNSFFGRALLVFFWGGLSASVVLMIYTFHHFNPVYMPWFVVFVNMVAVTIKNIVIPPGAKK